jgi:hypothetical protein
LRQPVVYGVVDVSIDQKYATCAISTMGCALSTAMKRLEAHGASMVMASWTWGESGVRPAWMQIVKAE